MIPTFEYRLSTAVDHGPASKQFLEAILKTKRFYRNDKSQILFEIAPNDLVCVSRKQELRNILDDGEVIKITGDPIDDSAEFGFWLWLTSQRWKIPRVETYRAVRQ